MTLKDVNKKIFVYGGIVLVVIAVLIIVLILLKPDAIKKQSYEGIEQSLVKAAKEYYKTNPSFLSSTEMVSVSNTTLETDKFLKPLEKTIKDKEVTCTGRVDVKPVGGDFLYFPYLSCGSAYETKAMKDVLLDPKNIVKTGNGLYFNNPFYYYRGELVNNYIQFSGKTWRILKVTADGTMKLLLQDATEKAIWDNRYNGTEGGNTGINVYEKSRIRETLVSLYYNDNFLTPEDRKYIINQKLCLDTKGKTHALDFKGSCKKVLSDPIGLITADDYGIASLDATCKYIMDPQCQNYNYIAALRKGWWTLTASARSTHLVMNVASRISESQLTQENLVRPVILLRGDLLYQRGTGTSTDPYILK